MMVGKSERFSKMKNKLKNAVKSVIGLCLIIVTLYWSAIAGAQIQPSPVTLPIQSQDALREYALVSVTYGYRSVYSDSMDWDFPERFTFSEKVTGNGAEDVLNKLFDIEFVYRLTNPDDKVVGDIDLQDKDGNQVFNGRAEYIASSLAGSVPQYNIWISSVRLPLSNVRSAEVLAISEKDGTTARRYPLEVRQGHPFFPPWMAGSPNGILVVRFEDESVMTYQLSKPIGQSPTSTTEPDSAWAIEGHHVVTTGTAPESQIVRIIETWNRPTLLLKVTSTAEITFDVVGIVQENGISFDRPSEVLYTQDGVSWTVIIIDPAEVQLNVVVLEIGTYRVRFNWTRFGKPQTLYTGPEYNELRKSGGGGATPVVPAIVEPKG